MDMAGAEMLTAFEVQGAIQADATAHRIHRKGMAPSAGDLVGVRLNLNILRLTGVLVHSIHRATSKNGHQRGFGFCRGEVISYRQVVTLRNAFFNVNQTGRDAIASGAMSKHPMASVDGAFVESGPCDLVDLSGIEVSFNPKRTHLFVDGSGFAIRRADEVTLFAHRAYARGDIEYFNSATAPPKSGHAPSSARFLGESTGAPEGRD